MKYRGVFKLNDRKDDPEGNWKFILIYHKREGFNLTYADALNKWLAKDGKVLK